MSERFETKRCIKALYKYSAFPYFSYSNVSRKYIRWQRHNSLFNTRRPIIPCRCCTRLELSSALSIICTVTSNLQTIFKDTSILSGFLFVVLSVLNSIVQCCWSGCPWQRHFNLIVYDDDDDDEVTFWMCLQSLSDAAVCFFMCMYRCRQWHCPNRR